MSEPIRTSWGSTSSIRRTIPTALADYSLHMRMFQFLAARDPKVKLALHAGELTLGLTPPRDLTFHIKEAVEVAGDRRAALAG